MPSPEVPIIEAAIFAMGGESTPQPVSRRELHARSRADRRTRVMVLLFVIGLVALVGIGVAVVATDGGGQSAAKSEVKVVGTTSPLSTASTLGRDQRCTHDGRATTPTPSGRVTTPVRTNAPATDLGRLQPNNGASPAGGVVVSGAYWATRTKRMMRSRSDPRSGAMDSGATLR